MGFRHHDSNGPGELYALVSGVAYRPQRKTTSIGFGHSIGLRR